MSSAPFRQVMRSVAIDPEGFRFLGLRLVDGGIGGGVDYNGRLNAVEKCGDAGVARKIDDGASSNDKIVLGDPRQR